VDRSKDKLSNFVPTILLIEVKRSTLNIRVKPSIDLALNLLLLAFLFLAVVLFTLKWLLLAALSSELLGKNTAFGILAAVPYN
jgi:hypothetical protein